MQEDFEESEDYDIALEAVYAYSKRIMELKKEMLEDRLTKSQLYIAEEYLSEQFRFW